MEERGLFKYSFFFFSFSLVICRAERIQSNVPVFLCALTYSSKVRSG